MKKLLGLLVVLAVALPASADVLKNIDIKGEIQTIASDVHHNTVAPAYYNNNTNTRVLAGLSAELVEDVTANVTFQYWTGWDGAPQGDNINAYENRIQLSEANVVLSNLFDCFEATIGRQFYGDEDSAVMYFGPNHYNAEGFGYARSLEAAKITYADDVKSFTFITGKTVLAGGLDLNGQKMFGADFRINLTDAIKLQSYIYDFQKVPAFNPEGDIDGNGGLYGAKLAFNPEAFLVSAEYARNFGGHRLIKEHKDTGYMIKADAALSIEAFKVRGAFLYENENFFAFGNYTPGLIIGHRLGGDMARYSIEGVRMFNLGFDVNPFEKWTFSLDGYSFQDRYAHHAATLEADLTAKYQHNEYVQLFGGFGYAKYGKATNAVLGDTYKAALNKDNFKWQLGMLINF